MDLDHVLLGESSLLWQPIMVLLHPRLRIWFSLQEFKFLALLVVGPKEAVQKNQTNVGLVIEWHKIKY